MRSFLYQWSKHYCRWWISVNIKKIEKFTKNIRKNIIFSAYKAGVKSAHIGGALSIADIVAVLYSDILRVKKQKSLDNNRDRFILSKGHACLALYAALVEKNFLRKKIWKHLK